MLNIGINTKHLFSTHFLISFVHLTAIVCGGTPLLYLVIFHDESTTTERHVKEEYSTAEGTIESEP